MADVSSTNESDWGPEQTQVPPVGSIFILKLYKTTPMPPVSSKGFRYRLVAIHGMDMDLENWESGDGRWHGGHSWKVAEGVAFRVLKGSAQVSVAKASNGCHCSKCNNYFPYAEPNQADGSLICWSCRNYPHYQGRLT